MATPHLSRDERVAFLADLHVGVLAVDEPGRGPFALPVWYVVDDTGDVCISTGGGSRKAWLAAAAGRATLTVQQEAPPYVYVSVEGPVVVEDTALDVEALASRYLGPDLGRWYAETNPTTPDTVTLRLTPEHWRTADYGKSLD